MAPMKVIARPLWRWLTVLTLVAGLLVAASWLPRRQRQDPLTVAVGLWPGSETLVLARERGLLPVEHVQLIEMTWASATMRAFGNGVVDAAVLSLDEVMRLRESGLALRVVMVMDASQGNDALMVREDVKSMADLKGKKVGVDLRAAGMYLLSRALDDAGMKAADLDLVPLNLPETEDAFVAKEVDAVVSAEPWLTKLRAAGAHSLYNSSQMRTPIYRVLVVSEEAMRDQPQDVLRVMKAHFAMLKLLNPRMAMPGLEATLQRQGLTQEEFFNCRDHLRLFDPAANRLLMETPDPALIKAAAAVEEDMRTHALLSRPLPTTPWLDSSLLKEAAGP